jgi:hypothetical protein
MSSPLFPSAYSDIHVQFLNADAANTWKTVVDNSNGTKPLRVEAKMAASTDTAAVVLQFRRTVGGVSYNTENVSIPATAGTKSDGSIRRVNLMTTLGLLQPDGISAWTIVPPGVKIEVSNLTQVTSAKQVDVTGWYSQLG